MFCNWIIGLIKCQSKVSRQQQILFLQMQPARTAAVLFASPHC